MLIPITLLIIALWMLNRSINTYERTHPVAPVAE